MASYSQSPVTFLALSRSRASFSLFLHLNAKRTSQFPLDYEGAIAIPSYNQDGRPIVPNVGSDNHHRHRGFKEEP